MRELKVTVYPQGVKVTTEEGKTLKDVFLAAGIPFDFPCGGLGKCGKCRVQIKEGGRERSVLACQFQVTEDTVVVTGAGPGEQRILERGVNRQVALNPLVKKIKAVLPQPSLADNRPDWTRLRESGGLNEVKGDLSLLRSLPEKLRRSNFEVNLVLAEEEVLAIREGDLSFPLLGMAFDIGTTTVVGYLLDLETGRELATVSALNPQTRYGADVISRIAYAAQEERGLDRLHEEIVAGINRLIAEATAKAGCDPADIFAVTIAGNTTMHHLFLKLSPENLARVPYVPVIKEAVVAGAAELNLAINPRGKVFVLPNIAGFVGADTVAAALAAEMDTGSRLRLLLDIGTNGEMVLGTGEKLLACSTAAGPAFEGAQISCGMRGEEGAIDHVMSGEELRYTVIGGGKPRGICGSGLVDIVAWLLEAGIVDAGGRILPPEKITVPAGQKYRERVVVKDGVRAFVIADGEEAERPVYLTQKDIRELQLAKGAIAAGIEILLKHWGAQVDDIAEVLLAGAFGNYLNPRSACRIGLLPPELEGRIRVVGNAAGAGAKFALLSRSEYRRALRLARRIHYIELSAEKEFSSLLVKKLNF